MNDMQNYCNMNNLNITLFGRINWLSFGLRTISVDDAIKIIREGTYYIDDTARSGMCGTLREITEQIQHLPEVTDLQPIKEQFLPAVSFNGVYSNGIVQYSSVTALDFDHIPSQEAYTDLYLRLMKTPYVRNIYRTPSGRGLKALVLHDNQDPSKHNDLYQQLMRMFQTPYIKTDPKCADLPRRNYLCYDPDVWSNPNPIGYHYIPTAAIMNTASAMNISKPNIKRSNDTPSDASIMNLLKSRCRRYHPDYLCEGARRDGVFWFGTQASKAGVDYDYGLEYVIRLYGSSEIRLTKGGSFTTDEIKENFNNGYEMESYDEDFRKAFTV